MHINYVEEQGFNVVGIMIRTTNKAARDNRTIEKLWQQFFTESIFSKIPHKVDQATVVVYYNFENGKNDEYNILIGARVSSVDQVPEGMVTHYVPAQKRAVFISDRGPVGQVCVELWNKIWSLEDQSKLDRAYIADYELYDSRSQDRHNACVAIHIGVK